MCQTLQAFPSPWAEGTEPRQVEAARSSHVNEKCPVRGGYGDCFALSECVDLQFQSCRVFRKLVREWTSLTLRVFRGVDVHKISRRKDQISRNAGWKPQLETKRCSALASFTLSSGYILRGNVSLNYVVAVSSVMCVCHLARQSNWCNQNSHTTKQSMDSII